MRLCAVIGGVAFVYVATVHGTEKWRMVNYGDGIPRENRPVFFISASTAGYCFLCLKASLFFNLAYNSNMSQ